MLEGIWRRRLWGACSWEITRGIVQVDCHVLSYCTGGVFVVAGLRAGDGASGGSVCDDLELLNGGTVRCLSPASPPLPCGWDKKRISLILVSSPLTIISLLARPTRDSGINKP